MSEVTKRLRDRRHRVWEDAKKLADIAADENRAFESEEQSQWDTLNAELNALDTRIKSLHEGEKRAKEAEESFAALEGRPQERGREQAGQDTELRKFLRGARGRVFDINPTGPVNFRALQKGSGTGGSVVPTSFYDQLVIHLIESSGLLQAGPTILRTAGGENIQVPKTLTHSAGSQIAEAAVNVVSEPTFGQLTLGAYKYGNLMQVSRELIDDNGVDLEGYLAMQAGRAVGNDFGEDLITGTGSTMPRGLSVDAGTAATGPLGVTGGFGTQSVVGQGYDLLIDTYHGVISPYRASSSCAWLMADASAAHVRKVKDTNGQYIWQPSVTIGAPDTILGKPVFIDPYVPAKGTANKWILFGDMSQYFVRFAGGIRFERSDDYAFNTDLVTFRCLLRADGALADLTGAVKAFRGGTA
jgi:HK97 family phage major capsid protein